ncbi:MAG: cyclic nucleotide-binding domain-containing protein [Bdellovibrionota bacterium]
MYLADESDRTTIEHANAYQHLCATITSQLEHELANITLDAQSELYLTKFQQGKIFKIREGVVKLSFKDRDLIYFEAGDLIGEWLVDQTSLALKTDFAVVVDQYDRGTFEANLCSDLNLINSWFDLLSFQLKFVLRNYGNIISDDQQPIPDIKRFTQGEVIIAEGESSDLVFTMLSGEASVTVAGIEVGQISKDEIFGALGPLTNQLRTATVTANSNCSVLALPSDNFEQLIASRPHTVHKLIEDMAAKIVALNQKLVDFSS